MIILDILRKQKYVLCRSKIFFLFLLPPAVPARAPGTADRGFGWPLNPFYRCGAGRPGPTRECSPGRGGCGGGPLGRDSGLLPCDRQSPARVPKTKQHQCPDAITYINQATRRRGPEPSLLPPNPGCPPKLGCFGWNFTYFTSIVNRSVK